MTTTDDAYRMLGDPAVTPDSVAVMADGERPAWLRRYPYRDYHLGVRCRRWLRYHPGQVVQFAPMISAEVYWCQCGRRRWVVDRDGRQVRVL